MHWSGAFVGALLVACATSDECLDRGGDAWERRLQDIHEEGGLVESCAPDKVEVMVHFDGPPRVESECARVPYNATMPDCTADLLGSGETDAAICRAVHTFPDHVALLGPALRVDASHEADEWRVRLASP